MATLVGSRCGTGYCDDNVISLPIMAVLGLRPPSYFLYPSQGCYGFNTIFIHAALHLLSLSHVIGVLCSFACFMHATCFANNDIQTSTCYLSLLYINYSKQYFIIAKNSQTSCSDCNQ